MTKDKFIKGGIKKSNQLVGDIFGFGLFDTVEYQKKRYFAFARRKSGFLDIRTLDGEKINNGSINYKKIKLIQKNNSTLTERKLPIPLQNQKDCGFLEKIRRR